MQLAIAFLIMNNPNKLPREKQEILRTNHSNFFPNHNAIAQGDNVNKNAPTKLVLVPRLNLSGINNQQLNHKRVPSTKVPTPKYNNFFPSPKVNETSNDATKQSLKPMEDKRVRLKLLSPDDKNTQTSVKNIRLKFLSPKNKAGDDIHGRSNSNTIERKKVRFTLLNILDSFTSNSKESATTKYDIIHSESPKNNITNKRVLIIKETNGVKLPHFLPHLESPKQDQIITTSNTNSRIPSPLLNGPFKTKNDYKKGQRYLKLPETPNPFLPLTSNSENTRETPRFRDDKIEGKKPSRCVIKVSSRFPEVFKNKNFNRQRMVEI